ncbi:MAG: hypothetical protein KHY83_00100 [Coriobacteriia bacterium]|nr:hypothetical protein [Coriobacteriia bacterium]MBS5477055.1 hypothetical protein [Coriobacteriia bacterium]
MSLPRQYASHFARGTLEAIPTHAALPSSSLLKTYVAFANTRGGVILIGARLEADGTLLPVGLEDPLGTIRELWSLVSDPARVSANILVNGDVRLEKLGGECVVSLRVPRARPEVRPIHIGNHVLGSTYRRVNGETQPCSAEEIAEMERASRPEADAVPLPAVPLSALELDTIDAYRAQLGRLHPQHPWLELDTPEALLLQLGAIGRSASTRRLHPSQAGLLLFGRQEAIVQELPFFALSCTEAGAPTGPFACKFAENDDTCTGNVFDFWRHIHSCLETPRIREGNVSETVVPLRPARHQNAIPSDLTCAAAQASQELIANALAHADYRARGGVSVQVGQDSISVESAGRLPFSEEAIDQGGLIMPRNPALKSMLELVGIGREQGGGITSLQATCAWWPELRLDIEEDVDPCRTICTLSLLRMPGRPYAQSNRPELPSLPKERRAA